MKFHARFFNKNIKSASYEQHILELLPEKKIKAKCMTPLCVSKKTMHSMRNFKILAENVIKLSDIYFLL